MTMLKQICEVRNKALESADNPKAAYCVNNSFFERNVNADLTLFMRSIKRKFKGELPREYHECQLYYKKQRKYFKDLKPYRNKDRQGMKRVPQAPQCPEFTTVCIKF